jgi:hypothetical protein
VNEAISLSIGPARLLTANNSISQPYIANYTSPLCVYLVGQCCMSDSEQIYRWNQSHGGMGHLWRLDDDMGKSALDVLIIKSYILPSCIWQEPLLGYSHKLSMDRPSVLSQLSP